MRVYVRAPFRMRALILVCTSTWLSLLYLRFEIGRAEWRWWPAGFEDAPRLHHFYSYTSNTR